MPTSVSFTQLGSPPVSSLKSLLEMLSRAVWRGECGTSPDSSSAGDKGSVMLQYPLLPHPRSCHLPLTHKILEKVGLVKTQGHYFNKEGILAQATTWRKLENNSEISKTQTKMLNGPFNMRFIVSGMVVARGCRSYCFLGRVSI